MKTTTNKTVSQQAESTLRLKRPLLSIAEYAARQGISTDIVEEYAKLGIIQIRKYKGKMFVVDVPLNQHPYTTQTPETTDQSTQLSSEDMQAEDIPEPMQVVSTEVLKIVNELTAAAADEIIKTKSLSELMHTPDSQAFEIADEKLKLVDETVKPKEKPKSTQINQGDGTQLGLSTAQAKSKRTWQIAALLSIIFLFATLFANLWLYMNRKIQLEKLNQANANIQTAYNNSRQASQKIETLQNELSISKTQIGRLQNELDNYESQVKTLQNQLDNYKSQVKTLQNELGNYKSQVKTLQNQLDNYKSQVKTLQNQLTQTRQNLRDLQERNAEAVERLNRQIQKLSAQPHNNYNNQ